MQCVECGGYRHEGPCPTTDAKALRKTLFALTCPWCGSDPGLAQASYVGDRVWYQVGCESDECPVNPQVSAYTLPGAWDKWNRRAPVEGKTELELAGAGGIKWELYT